MPMSAARPIHGVRDIVPPLWRLGVSAVTRRFHCAVTDGLGVL
jgi:hypothetical protein